MNTAPELGPDPDVERLVAEYLSRVEDGEEPELGAFLTELAEDRRTEFRDLVDSAAWARSTFPVVIRSHYVLAGRYELLSELGSGGFGKVWSAFDRDLERKVAVKVMSLWTESSLESAMVHETERRALARVHHPGTVAIHEAGCADDVFFIVMDLLDGTSMEKVVARLASATGPGSAPAPAALEAAIGRPCPAGQRELIEGSSYFRTVARIMAEILCTLEAVHAEGVIHRDIKPSNVVLCGGGRPVLLDFGVAALREGSRGQVTERLIGTMGYLAPEQLATHRIGADPRTDVYQVGLILYELLTLRTAFAPSDKSSIVDDIRTGRFVLPHRASPSVPRSLADVCLLAMECSPHKRYQSARAFREDLERYLDGSVAPLACRNGRLGGLVRDARYLVRRNRTAALVAAALCVGLVPAAYYALSNRPPVLDLVQFELGESGTGTMTVDVSGAHWLFALFVQTDESGADGYALPLRLEAAASSESRGPAAGASPGPTPEELPGVAGAGGWSAALDDGRHRIDLAAPAVHRVRDAEFRRRKLILITAEDTARADDVRAAWQEIDQRTRKTGATGPGLSLAELRGLLVGLGSAGRGAGALTLPVDRILGGGTWQQHGLGGVEYEVGLE